LQEVGQAKKTSREVRKKLALGKQYLLYIRLNERGASDRQ